MDANLRITSKDDVTKEKLATIVDLEFWCGDLEQKITLRSYLEKLTHMIWKHQECFDGKRPFGNSDWAAHTIESLLVENGITGMKKSDYDYEYDCSLANEIIHRCIEYIFSQESVGGMLQMKYAARNGSTLEISIKE